MIKYELKYTQCALNDLTGIKGYIVYELENPEAADRTIRNIISAIESLEEFPERGAYLFKYCPGNIRFLPAGNHLIVYRLDGEYVEILRVMYKRQDVLRKRYR